MQAETKFLDPTRSLMVYANLDTSANAQRKQFPDAICGHQRFDVFRINIDQARQRPVTFANFSTEA